MESIQDIQIDMIEPNPNQPRKHFDDGSLQELAESIKSKGLLEPIIIRPLGDKYQIVCGERRLRACKMAGLEKIQAIVKEYDAEEAFEASLTENVQRDNLTPIEEAEAYQSLIERGLTHDDVARKIHKGRTYVTQKMRLLDLPKSTQDLLNDKLLLEGHARQLLRFKDMLKDSRDIPAPGGLTLPMWHLAVVFFDEEAWLNNWSVSQLKDEIDAWWWNILHAKWKLNGHESRAKEAMQAINERVSPHPDSEFHKYIMRLWRWNIPDTTLTTDQHMWHMDYWTYHSRVEKGLCWVYDCENQPVRKVKHHWYDISEKDSTAGMTTKAIYRSIITMCEAHCKNVSRDTSKD